MTGFLASAPGSVLAQNGPNSNNNIGYNFDKLKGLPPFRNIPWGSSKEYILENDVSERIETGEDYLILKDNLADIEVEVTYFLWRKHFIKGVYKTTEHMGEYSSYIEVYQRFKELLSKKYGNPMIDLTNWSDIQYKNQPSKWLLAISKGHLEHVAYWEQQSIIISIKFEAVEGQPVIKIEYYIQNFNNEIEETDDTDVLQDL